MRRRQRSLFGQLLIACSVAAVLVGAAAAGGYLTASRQEGVVRQLTSRYQVLQEADGRLEADFITAAFAVHDYALTAEQRFLGPLARAQAEFDGQMSAIQRHAPPVLRSLVAAQAETGYQWFDLMPQIAEVTPRSVAAKRLLASSARIAGAFVRANTAMQRRIHDSVAALTASSHRAVVAGLAWTVAALAVAVLLVLATSLSTFYTVSRPLRRLTATVGRLTAGDHAARASVAGSGEVREVASAVNTLADEADRLRQQEAESNRLRATAREIGLRIREHLVADEVLRAAQAGLAQHLEADVLYLRLIENGRMGAPVGPIPAWFGGDGAVVARLSGAGLAGLEAAFRAQTSLVIPDVRRPEGDTLPPYLRDRLRHAGVRSQVITPFGAGSELLGIVVAQRTSCRRWTPAEIDMLESVAADLGRGLNQARLYEAENRLVEDLRELDQARSDFFATVSHELRAPLTTIEGYVEMLGDGAAGAITPQQGKMLETIARSSVRLRNLVEDLLTLSKLESNGPRPVLRPVSVAEVIADAVEAARPSVEAAKLDLSRTGTADGLIVNGDAGQLGQVLGNLLSNAVKFTPEGGHIKVAVTAEDGSAVITVGDTGIGIPERDQKELFTRFARASNATARRIPGTGLGLVIVATIVANHGGEVQLDSAEGSGTTVTVRLPLLARPPAARQRSPGAAAGHQRGDRGPQRVQPPRRGGPGGG